MQRLAVVGLRLDTACPLLAYATVADCLTLISRDNDSDKFTVPVLCQGSQENRNYVGPSTGL